jgi:hypothetical protein
MFVDVAGLMLYSRWPASAATPPHESKGQGISVSPVFIIISVAIVPVGVILTMYRRSNRRAEWETGLTSIAEERCGALFDSVRFSAPLVRVAIYEDFLVVASWNLVVEKYDAVTSLEIQPAPLGKVEVKIRLKEHTVTLTLPGESHVLDALRRKLKVRPWRP